MSFRRYANAIISQPNVCFDRWMDELRVQHEGAVHKDKIARVARTVLRKCDPQQYLLSHATIVASVDCYEPKGVKTGGFLNRDIECQRRYADFRIKPECQDIINNNGDAWSRPLLLATYRTFIGAPNYLEHVQIPELSKGFIVDAIARDLGNTCYVDILVATDRKHRMLVSDILAENIRAMSMGCFIEGTRVTLGDGSILPIEQIRPGMQVVSQKGNICNVNNLQIRENRWSMRRVKVSGLQPIDSTDWHEFYVATPGIDGRHVFNKVRAADLRVGDVVATPIPKVTVAPDVSLSEARFLGFWIGDGWKWENKHDATVGVGLCCDIAHSDIADEMAMIMDQVAWKAGETRMAVGDDNRWSKARFISALSDHGGSFSALCRSASISRQTGAAWRDAHRTNGGTELPDLCKEPKRTLTVRRRNANYLTISSPAVRRLIDAHTSGRKSLDKSIAADVMLWPREHQLAFLSGVIDSDGCVSTLRKGGRQVFISTRNENLANQYLMLLARCGSVATLSKAVRHGTKMLPNSGGVDYQIRIRNDGARDIPSTKIRKNADNLRSRPNRDRWIGDGYLFTKVKRIDQFEFTGSVYDLQVDGDHSYVVNGVGVSNCISLFTICNKCGNVAADDTQICPCILYDGKGSKFLDESGVEHKLAELIGHVSVPNSNQFIEASWVRNPAFAGAERRNILNLEAASAVAAKVDEAANIYEIRRDEVHLDGMARAASRVAQGDEGEETGEAEADADAEADVDPFADDEGGAEVDKELGDAAGGDVAEGEGDETAAPSPVSPGDKMQELLDKASEMLMENLVKNIAEKTAPKPEDVGTATPGLSDADYNDNLVGSFRQFDEALGRRFPKSPGLVAWASRAYRTVHGGGVRAIHAARMSSRDLIVLSWIEDSVRLRAYPALLYKLAMETGPSSIFPSEASYLAACGIRAGRRLSSGEDQFLIWKGRIGSLSVNFISQDR